MPTIRQRAALAWSRRQFALLWMCSEFVAHPFEVLSKRSLIHKRKMHKSHLERDSYAEEKADRGTPKFGNSKSGYLEWTGSTQSTIEVINSPGSWLLSLVAQCDQRIHARSAARRQISGDRCDHEQYQGRQPNGQRIVRFQIEQQTFHPLGRRQYCPESEHHTHRDPEQRLAQDQLHDALRACSQRHPNADLLRAARHVVSQYAV